MKKYYKILLLLLVDKNCTEYLCRDVFFLDNLVNKRSQPVEEYAADIIMGDGWFLGTGSHAKRPQEVVHQDVKLLDVLGL